MFEAEYAIQRNQNDAQHVIQIEGRIDLARYLLDDFDFAVAPLKTRVKFVDNFLVVDDERPN